jgi:hypothetical protein
LHVKLAAVSRLQRTGINDGVVAGQGQRLTTVNLNDSVVDHLNVVERGAEIIRAGQNIDRA